MMSNQALHSDLAIPPGEYLKELIDECGMSENDLASRMGYPVAKLRAIFNGDKAISPEIAMLLERGTGISAHIWLGLEFEYRRVKGENNERVS